MNQPLVSVLMTAYNREKYIAEAIESVIASTYQNWKLIIVDDCSSDRTVEIARSYEAKDDRIKVYINEKNLGDYPNRNKAASYAKGKYLKYVDADDVIYPNCIEKYVDWMEKYPEVGICLSKRRTTRNEMDSVLQNALKYHYLKKAVLNNAPLSVIIRASAFNKVAGFRNHRHFGDEDLWIRIAKVTKVLLIPEFYTWWRSHDQQESKSRSTNFEVVFKQYKMNFEHINDPNAPFTESEKRIAIDKLKNALAKRSIKCFLNLRLQVGIRLKREFNLGISNYFVALKTAI